MIKIYYFSWKFKSLFIKINIKLFDKDMFASKQVQNIFDLILSLYN